MRFSTKLSLAVAVLLAVSLSIGGYFLVRQNFNETLQSTVGYNTNQHVLERYALESELLALMARDEEETDEQLVRYGLSLMDYFGEGQKMLAFYSGEYTEIFTSFPTDIPPEARLQVVHAGMESYQLFKQDGRVYMLLASHINGPNRELWLLSGYDITNVFAQRQSQLYALWRMEAIVLAGALVVVVLLSHMLTRPFRRLNAVSRKIAQGAYSVRTRIETKDEVGELSRNFDEMASAVEEQVEQLNSSVQQRDDFITAFTHEIKTPMTSIIGYSDILRSMESDPKTRQRAANYIFNEAKRLEGLSQKLLMLMGLSEEELVLEPQSVASIFIMVQRSLLPMPEGIALQFTNPGKLTVQADKDLVVDLIRNLALNAIKAEPTDGVVQVNCKLEGDCCRFVVYDTGRGIPAEDLRRIKEPFYMVDKSRARAQGGSGIGLALCEKIAVLHGTTLQFKSRVGVGTAVSFVLQTRADAKQPQTGGTLSAAHRRQQPGSPQSAANGGPAPVEEKARKNTRTDEKRGHGA